MAEHCKAHLWANTTIAFLALLVAGLSAVFSWQVSALKRESLGFSEINTFGFLGQFRYKCELQYSTGDFNTVTMCWLLTISNQSDIRVSITSYDISFISQKDTVPITFFFGLMSTNNTHVSMPLVLEGGDAREFVVQVPIEVTDEIIQLARELLSKAKGSPQSPVTIGDLGEAANKAHMNLVGKKYSPNGPYIIELDNLRHMVDTVTFNTGRGNIFKTQLTFIPFFIQRGSDPTSNSPTPVSPQ